MKIANDVSLCSNALLLVGDSPITEFGESDGGIAAEQLYPQAKDEFLSTHPWSFALKTQRLNLNSATPDAYLNYQYSLSLPPDLISLWRLIPWMNYTINGRNIYCNSNEVLAEYTYSCPESAFSASARTALEYLMASKLAMTVVENNDLATLMGQHYLRQLGQAQTIDAQQRPQVAIQDNPFNSVRGGNSRGYF